MASCATGEILCIRSHRPVTWLTGRTVCSCYVLLSIDRCNPLMTSRGEPGERLGVWFSLCAISRFKIRPRAELHCFGWRKATLSAKASRLGGFTRSRPGRMSVAGLGTSTAVGSGRKYRGTGSRSHWRKQKRDSWRVGRLCSVSAGADRLRVRP
jgi:hypothetical protein